ncbi:MAG: tetratricopeptide repeat protein, partial [Anaerolineales bacterium]
LPFLSDYHYPGRITAQLIGALILGGWLLWKWLAQREFGRTALDVPFCAMLAVTALSTVLSTDPRSSLEGLLYPITYALIFYLLLDLRRHARVWSALVNAVLIVAGIVCLLGSIQFAWWYGDLPAIARDNPALILQGEVPLPRLSVLGNPNILAVYLLLVFPLGVHRCLSVRRRPARLLFNLGLAAAAPVFFLTRSRAGMVGLGAACTVALLLTLRRPGRSRSIPKWVIAIGVVLLSAAASVVLSRGGLSPAGSTAQVRWESWRVALQVLLERPLFGSGPRTFASQLLRYWDPFPFSSVHSHAHSMYMTLVAEIGGLGLLALLWLGVAFAVGLRQRNREHGGFALGAACAIGLVGWAAHSLLDTFIDEPVIIWTALVLGAGAMPQPRTAGRKGGLARLTGATLAFIIVCGVSMWVNYGFAAHHAAREAAMAGDWEGATEWLETAMLRDPANRLYRQEAAFSWGVLACGDSSYLANAIAGYEVSLQGWGDWPLDHANLAVLLARAGETDVAIREMQLAADLDSKEPLYACHLGGLLEDAGRLDEAIEYYARCLARAPSWLTSAFWEGTTWRVGARTRIVAAAESEVLSGWGLLARAELRYYAGRLEEALDDVVQSGADDPDSTRAMYEEARILAAMGRNDEALGLLDDLLERSPLEGAAWLLSGRIHLQEGELDDAAYDFENGAALLPGSEPLYWLGRWAEAQGDAVTAAATYREAVVQATSLEATQFATSLGGRLPLPVEQLPCLVQLRSYDSFVAPALNLGRLLEEGGRCDEAAELYELVLSQEPHVHEVRERLEDLTCVVDDR